MTWHKPLPAVLPLPEPAAGQGQEEHFLPKPLTFPKPFFRPPAPARSVQRKKRPKPCWQLPSMLAATGLSARALFYIFIRLGGRRQSTRNGFGLKYFS